MLMIVKQSFENVFPAVQEQVELTKQRKIYARDMRASLPVPTTYVHKKAWATLMDVPKLIEGQER
jgi:hypothetical protein